MNSLGTVTVEISDETLIKIFVLLFFVAAIHFMFYKLR